MSHFVWLLLIASWAYNCSKFPYGAEVKNATNGPGVDADSNLKSWNHSWCDGRGSNCWCSSRISCEHKTRGLAVRTPHQGEKLIFFSQTLSCVFIKLGLHNVSVITQNTRCQPKLPRARYFWDVFSSVQPHGAVFCLKTWQVSAFYKIRKVVTVVTKSRHLTVSGQLQSTFAVCFLFLQDWFSYYSVIFVHACSVCAAHAQCGTAGWHFEIFLLVPLCWQRYHQ
jgi:hypothetical protein